MGEGSVCGTGIVPLVIIKRSLNDQLFVAESWIDSGLVGPTPPLTR